MAGRFCDSFDHYSTTEIDKKWTQQFSASVQGSGRHGNCIFFASGLSSSSQISKTIDYQTKWVVGFAYKLPSSSSGLTGSGTIYGLDNCGVRLCSLTINPDSTLCLLDSTNTLIPGSLSTATFPFDTWQYVEMRTELSTDGLNIGLNVTVRLNGVDIIGPLNADSKMPILSVITQAANANQHIFQGMHGDPSGAFIDDLYIVDGNGSNNDFLGDVEIGFIVPDADVSTGMSIQPTSPTTHFDKVDENPPDYDTSYIYTNGSGVADDFKFQPIANFSGTIPFVQYLLFARKDDEGSVGIQHTVGGSPRGTVTPIKSLSDQYLYYLTQMDNNPAQGGNAWTVANFNAQDFGVQLTEIPPQS